MFVSKLKFISLIKLSVFDTSFFCFICVIKTDVMRVSDVAQDKV